VDFVKRCKREYRIARSSLGTDKSVARTDGRSDTAKVRLLALVQKSIARDTGRQGVRWHNPASNESGEAELVVELSLGKA
jgi:hypothetical protein